MKKIIISMLCMLSAWAQVVAQANSANTRLEIYQIKVTEGHATLVVTKSTATPSVIYKSVLIDAGNDNRDANAIETVINNVAGGRLDAVFVTHHDKDHWGGLYGSNGSNGLLGKRCRPSGSLYDENTLKLYLNHAVSSNLNDNDNHPAGPQWDMANIKSYAGGAENINIKNWTNGLRDIPLVPASTGNPSFIWLKTLAVNGYLEGENTTVQRLMLGKKATGFFKNNASAVALITWDDFSFLVQGDLEAAFAGQHYKHNDRNVAVNTQGKPFEIKKSTEKGKMVRPRGMTSTGLWAATNAKTNHYYGRGKTSNQLDDINGNYVIRMNQLNKGDVITSSSTSPSSPAAKRIKTTITGLSEANWVAAPSDWYHKLGQKINSANGRGAYAHACVALVPHHGAETSNLWFDTDHAIIGSNRSNKHRHPKKDALIALYNSAKPKYTYITYLLDNKKGNRNGGSMNTDVYKTFDKGHFPTDNTFNIYYLDGKGSSLVSMRRDATPYFKGPVGTEDVRANNHKVSYFKFTVRPTTTGSKKEIMVETDHPMYSGANRLLGWAECSRSGH